MNNKSDTVSLKRLRARSRLLIVASTLLFPAVALASLGLSTFEDGTPIIAADVNDNFERLETEALLRQMTIPPVGSVTGSILSEASFSAETGGTWVLADGRNINGTVLSRLAGISNVPDFRGLFLRAANGNRDDGQGNPEGDLELGSYQGDVFESHQHPGPGVSGLASGPVVAGHGVPTLETAASFLSGFAGGVETRPRNATVNFFIRVE